MANDIFIKFRVDPIQEEDHHTEIKAIIYLYDEDMVQIKIGFIEMVQFNFANALEEGYHWLSLIDEVNDDVLRLFEPLVKNSNCFKDDFQDILDDHAEEVRSIISIQRIFINKKYRGKKMLPSILKIIRKFNYCPIVASPLPLQHASGHSNKKLMGYEGNKKEFKKDLQRLREYYESNGFKRVGKSKTWVLI